MSQEMNRIAGNGYNYLSNAPARPRVGGLRSYIGQRVASAAGYSTPSPPGISRGESEERQGWRAWAGEKARRWRGSPGGSDVSLDSYERLRLFPGWATRRYCKDAPEDGSPRPFEVEIFASGYAVAFKNRETMSRSQRAFIRVAKGFAALPKLASQATLAEPEQPAPLSKSTEELLSHIHLPPRPDEVKDGYDVEELDRQFRRTQTATSDASSTSSVSSTEDLAAALKEAEQRTDEMTAPTTLPLPALSAEALRRMHANLEARLEPFWSSVLPNRTVRLKLYATAHQEPMSPPTDDPPKPLASFDVTTGIDGSFQARFIVKWDDLCQHPSSLHIAFGEQVEEHDLIIRAELLQPQPIAATTTYVQYQSPRQRQKGTGEATYSTSVKINITHSPIRVISDIDDTVKQAGVPNGARAVFHNVFVKELSDCIVDGMGEWYNKMWDKGVRFHYVSNGPFEFMNILEEFFSLSKLPPGSIKLRSFAGRSLFSGLFSAPADRKRAGVEDIIKAFPESRFFLVGDSGEQDLELYVQVARAYPDNVLGVYIRDVTTIEGVTDPLLDPTGLMALDVQEQLANRSGGASVTSLSSGDPSPTAGKRARAIAKIRGAGKRSSSSFSSLSRFTGDSTISAKDELADGMFFTKNDGALVLTVEPESLVGTSDDGRTPRVEEGLTLDSLATVTADLNMQSRFETEVSTPTARVPAGVFNSVNKGVSRPVITEGPKPTPPPLPQRRHTGSNVTRTSPTSSRAQRQGTTSSSASESDSNVDLDERIASRMSSIGSISPGALEGYAAVISVLASFAPVSGVSLEEKKRGELQLRVWRARLALPPHVKLRVFKNPKECEPETEEILQREMQAL